MNANYKTNVQKFLDEKIIAVAGYSSKGDTPGNAIYQKLKKAGYQVYALNPRPDQVKEVACYPNLASLPEKPGAVMICTPPKAAEQLVEECHEHGVDKVWMHRSMGNGSYSATAEKKAREYGMLTLGVGCPMMFLKPDLFHRCFRWIMDKQGKLVYAAN